MHITDRLHDSKWGIFTHYLEHEVNSKYNPLSQGRGGTSWDECVKELNVQKLASDIHEAGAHYYFITLMQGSPCLLGPNATFDRIAGTKPGEACTTRDLIPELADELAKYGIDLYVYYTGDGPYKNDEIGRKFGFYEPRDHRVSEEFVQNWSAVLEEYAVRFGDKVKGWWIDGCYEGWYEHDDKLLGYYLRAVKKGNPNAIVAFNDGCKPDYQKYYEKEDFVCGEFTDFLVVPKTRFVDGAQTHMLAPLGVAAEGQPEWFSWCCTGAKRSGEYLRNFISCCNANGGVVTIDVAIYRDGSLDRGQIEELKKIGI